MLFHNLAFFVFLPFAVFAARARISWQVRKCILVLLSYFVVFYTTWEPLFVALVFGLTCIDWTIARRIAATQDKRRRGAWLVCSAVVNIGLLGTFKYENATAGVILPLGISFYTFQSLSYTIDVYRGRAPCESFVDYALFLAFFPRFVSGPIVRASQFLPQCEAPRPLDLDTFFSGLSLIIIGVCGKIELADRILGPVVERAFEGGLGHGLGLFNLWTGIIAYPCQIFFDFAGYSMAAIGAARCLGFELPPNFNFPFAAQSVTEFWRRWHVSLSSWIRDYVYLPLTMWFAKRTRRISAGRVRDILRPAGSFAAILITMALMGLWHGAMWTMVLFGVLHGVVLTVEALRERARRTKNPEPRRPTWFRMILPIAGTYLIISLLLVLFRAPSIRDAFTIWHHAVGTTLLVSPDDLFPGLILAAAVSCLTVSIHVFGRDTNFEAVWSRAPFAVRGLVLGAMMFFLSLHHGDTGFIYAGF